MIGWSVLECACVYVEAVDEDRGEDGLATSHVRGLTTTSISWLD